MSETPSPGAGSSDRANSLLARALVDARRLLDFCQRHQRDVKPATIAQILEADRGVEAGDLAPETEARFWEAFGELCDAAAPASAESLEMAGRRWGAKQHVAVYAVITLATLVLLISIQVYWLVGGSLLGDLKEHIKEFDQTTQAILSAHRHLDPSKETTGEVEALYLKMRATNAQLQTGMYSLEAWNLFWGRMVQPFNLAPPFISAGYYQLSVYGKALVNADSAGLVLRALFTYALPLLYGLLGACVYIIREASRDIRASVFTHESATHYFSRLILGPIAGIVIGLFVTPDTASGPGLLHSLGLPALAFVAGYSVEIVFTLMDRMINAVSKPGAVPDKSKDSADAV